MNRSELRPPAALSSLDAFLAHLAATWSFVPGALGPDQPFADMPDLDSLGRLQLLLVVEDLGLTLDEGAFSRCETVREVFDLAARSAAVPPSARGRHTA